LDYGQAARNEPQSRNKLHFFKNIKQSARRPARVALHQVVLKSTEIESTEGQLRFCGNDPHASKNPPTIKQMSAMMSPISVLETKPTKPTSRTTVPGMNRRMASLLNQVRPKSPMLSF
jgi:hypothetical protein